MVAKKQKTSYHGRKAKIVAILTSQVKLEMLEGPARGEQLKRPLSAVQSWWSADTGAPAETKSNEADAEAAATAASAGATGNGAVAGAAATGAAAGDWGDCKDMFGDVGDVV